jgi:hypothetical protein
MDEGEEYDLSNAFLSISTEGSPPEWAQSATSLVTDRSRSRAAGSSGRRVASGERQQAEPLARAISRRERPLSSWIWSDEYLTQSSNPQSLDLAFERRIARGTTRLAPRPPPWGADGKAREPGTLDWKEQSLGLATDGEGARLRRTHLGRSVTRSPVLTFATLANTQGLDSLLVYHNAFRAELQSLYLIISSVEKRVHDLNESDIRSLYTWLGTFGDFLRLYFCAAERYVLNVIEDTCDMELREDMVSGERKRAKLRIVRWLEEMEALKRPMEAQPQTCSEVIPVLTGVADKLSMALLRYLNAEFEQLPSILSAYFHKPQLAAMFRQVDAHLLQSASGPLMHAMLSRGSAEKRGDQVRWLRRHVQRLYKHRTQLPSSVVAKRWSKRFLETHDSYARGFAQAESEYIRLYGQ